MICDRIVERGGRRRRQCRRVKSSAARYRYANDRERVIFNPGADIKPSAIAMFIARDRCLQPEEIGVLSGSNPCSALRLLLKTGCEAFILISSVRKTEFIWRRGKR